MAIKIDGTTVIDDDRNADFGDVKATKYEGDGSKLTAIPAEQLDWSNLPEIT